MLVTPHQQFMTVESITVYIDTQKSIKKATYEYREPVTSPIFDAPIVLCHTRVIEYVRECDMWNDILETCKYFSTKYLADVRHIYV